VKRAAGTRNSSRPLALAEVLLSLLAVPSMAYAQSVGEPSTAEQSPQSEQSSQSEEPEVPAGTKPVWVRLRDSTSMAASRVTLNSDGMWLDQADLIPWHHVHAASLPGNQRARFDQFHRQLGVPLARLRQRLVNGDWQNLDGLATEILASTRGDRSLSEVLALSARCREKITRFRRADAAVTWLQCLEILKAWREEPASLQQRLAELHRFFPRNCLAIQLDDVCPQLLPVFFDPRAAADALVRLRNGDRDDELHGPFGHWVGQLYVAALMIAAGPKADSAADISDWLPVDEPAARDWVKLVQAEQFIKRREFVSAATILAGQNFAENSPQAALVRYYRSIIALSADDPGKQQAGFLDLAEFRVQFGREYPGLAAASLFALAHCRLLENRPESAASILSELTVQFPESYHARLMKRSQPNSQADN